MSTCSLGEPQNGLGDVVGPDLVSSWCGSHTPGQMGKRRHGWDSKRRLHFTNQGELRHGEMPRVVPCQLHHKRGAHLPVSHEHPASKTGPKPALVPWPGLPVGEKKPAAAPRAVFLKYHLSSATPRSRGAPSAQQDLSPGSG